MNNRKNLLAVMDIGSSKINCMQCFTDNNDITKVIGLSTIASKGVTSGVITDFNLAYDSISKAIKECEKLSNENIGELAISISSDKCFTKTIRAKSQVKDEIITAQDIKLRDGKIEELTDLQIVNGAQTTASLFHTFNKEQNIELEKIYVQMKLTIMPKSQDADLLVVDIARYANTQNKETDADFFTNHPYHLRIEVKSRRKFLDPKHGEVKPTKW